MTDADLQACLAYWQPRLRLADWHIVAEFARGADLDGNVGDTALWWESRKAKIRIVPQNEWRSGRIPHHPLDDEEDTLVHELLHCAFSGFEEPPSTPEGKLQHQVINALAAALIEEHRRHD